MSNQRKENGPLLSLQKRVRTLEALLANRVKPSSVDRWNESASRTSLLERLDELTREAERIQAQLRLVGDHTYRPSRLYGRVPTLSN